MVTSTQKAVWQRFCPSEPDFPYPFLLVFIEFLLCDNPLVTTIMVPQGTSKVDPPITIWTYPLGPLPLTRSPWHFASLRFLCPPGHPFSFLFSFLLELDPPLSLPYIVAHFTTSMTLSRTPRSTNISTNCHNYGFSSPFPTHISSSSYGEKISTKSMKLDL